MTPAEQLALWADRLRDMAASGLKYAQNIYDHWFSEDALPDDLFAGHVRRVQDSYRVWRGELQAHFDM